MNLENLTSEMMEALAEIPSIDVHTHLVGGQLGAKGLHDIILYHMSISDLYAAGCPSGSRLTEYPGWPDQAESERRLIEAIPFLPKRCNTAISWGIRLILKDLYGWRDPVTLDNWRKLDGMIRERSMDRSWHREVLKRLHIKRVGTEYMRREAGLDDDILEYAMEWAFFLRCQWGEYDTPLYELERCWGKAPQSPTPIGAGKRPSTEKVIRTLDDVREAMRHYTATLGRLRSHPTDAKARLVAATIHISTDLDLESVSDSEMAEALSRRDHAGERERSIYASYLFETFLDELRVNAPGLSLQFSFGAEPLPHETMSRLSQRTLRQLAQFVGRHRDVDFQCFLAARHANQALCTMARELPNFSLVGYWWHTFFPTSIRQLMAERLEMLPVNKQAGFFSDAYCIEWVHGKALIARRCLAEVLADKIQFGQYDREEACHVAKSILYETPQIYPGMTPSDAL